MDDDDAGEIALSMSLAGAPFWLCILFLVLGLYAYSCHKDQQRAECTLRGGTYTHVGKQWLCVRNGQDPFIDLED